MAIFMVWAWAVLQILQMEVVHAEVSLITKDPDEVNTLIC